MRQFGRVVVGDVTSASGNEGLLRGKGVKVDVLEDQDCIALYDFYRRKRPDLDLEDWRGWRPFMIGRTPRSVSDGGGRLGALIHSGRTGPGFTR